MSNWLYAGAGDTIGAIIVYFLMKSNPGLCPETICFPEQICPECPICPA